jgi:serine/threonine protein kinase
MGLARSIAETEEAGITRAGTTVGTVDYMSPEQARDSKSADCRSDMYSLGATWYHMLAGKPLFPKGDLLNKITAHATETPPDPRDIRPNIPESVVHIMHRMLEKKPARRYQTPTELLHDLENGFSTEAMSRDASTTDSEKVLSFDILAGLAEEAPEGDAEIRVHSRKSTRESRREIHDSQNGDSPGIVLPETAILKVKPVDSSAAVATSTTARRKKSRKAVSNRKSSPAIPKKSPSAAETIADAATTSNAIPSVREVMLARNIRHRHTAENRKQMVMLGACVLGVLVVGYIVYSSLTGPSAAEAPASGNSAPAAGPSAAVSPVDKPPANGGQDVTPARQPPRRVD